MTAEKHFETTGELEFAALHADDLLLDALGGRRRADAVVGSGDVVAGLLQAYVHELDTRPGPLTGLLADSDLDGYARVPLPVAVKAPAPAETLVEPVALPSRRRPLVFGAAHKAAAVATVGALVLGLGGVSAAVTGQGGPLEGIRHVYNSVTHQATPEHSAEEKISRTLDDAQTALAANDLRVARDLLEKARADIEDQSDQTAFSTLRANLVQLRDRWHREFDQDFAGDTATTPTTPKAGEKLNPVPGGPVLAPPTQAGDIVRKNDPTETLAGTGSGVKQTKDQIADHAEQKLDPLPTLPVGELRAPTWAPIIGGK